MTADCDIGAVEAGPLVCSVGGMVTPEFGADPTGTVVNAYQKGVYPRQRETVDGTGVFSMTVDCGNPTTLWASPGPVDHARSAKTAVAAGASAVGLILVLPCAGGPGCFP
jgi:hypothetical protein